MKNSHLVVLGSGHAGMLAAYTLAPFFSKITIIERHTDILSSTPNEARMGLPQASHLHVLLQSGQRYLEEFMPNILQELQQYSCQEVDWAKDTKWYGPFGCYPQYDSPTKTLGFSRTCLDYVMLQRIKALPNVSIMVGDAVRLVMDNNSISSIAVYQHESKSENLVAGDLFIDARGRRSNILELLQQHHFKTPTPLTVHNSLAYASRRYQLHSNGHQKFKQFYIQVRPGSASRGVVLSPIENNQLTVTLIALDDEKPSRNPDEFNAFLQSLNNAELNHYLSFMTPAGDIHLCRNLHNTHFQLGSMKQWPKKLLVIGDAACLLNPVYGQGMTVISQEIKLLLNYFENKKYLTTGWEHRFQKHVDKLLKLPWSMATAEDQRSLSAEQLPFSTRLLHRYYDGILKLSMNCKQTHMQLIRVLHMSEFPSVFFKPKTILKVLRYLR